MKKIKVNHEAPSMLMATQTKQTVDVSCFLFSVSLGTDNEYTITLVAKCTNMKSSGGEKYRNKSFYLQSNKDGN